MKQPWGLVVNTSTARVTNMIDVVKRLTDGAGSKFFLFVDQERFVAGELLEASRSALGTTLRPAQLLD